MCGSTFKAIHEQVSKLWRLKTKKTVDGAPFFITDNNF